jgi:hypothetical protein
MMKVTEMFSGTPLTRRIGTFELPVSPSRRVLSRRTQWWLLRRSLREVWAVELSIDRTSMFRLPNRRVVTSIWHLCTLNHQHWDWHNWNNIHSLATIDSLKRFPWTTYKTNPQEKDHSYWRNEQ